ncbi:hypothetical protein ACQBAT_12550 [Ornithinimicrobium sp. Y1847]|uniref:hypothetical protein n=1 Tax=unclassified Ornithinimicrobium TaxID=2615080 RepID=UPI003B681EF9
MNGTPDAAEPQSSTPTASHRRRWLTPAVAVVLTAILFVVDPWRAGASWWEQAGSVLPEIWRPVTIWVVLAALASFVALRWARTWDATITLTTGLLVGAFVIASLVHPFLVEAFPVAGRLMISVILGLVALPVFCIALMALIFRPALHRILDRHAAQQRRW